MLERIVNGYRNKEIGEELGISVRTVEVHRRNVMDKLGVRNLAQLVRLVERGQDLHYCSNCRRPRDQAHLE